MPYAHSKQTLHHKMAASRRALHFVFKVADRTSTAAFYRDVLGMKVRWLGPRSTQTCKLLGI